MSELYAIAIDGLSHFRDLETLPADVKRYARMAINKAAPRARTAAAAEIMKQVAFPTGYLNPGEGRLVVSSPATDTNLETRVTARMRPTSLARFTKGGVIGKTGVTVEVAPGFAKFMKRAFLIKLPAGSSDVETAYNMALAIRLKPGETIQHKHRMVRMKGNLYLLYGPSVSQVFDTVRGDITPDVADYLAQEFTRLMGLDI